MQIVNCLLNTIFTLKEELLLMLELLTEVKQLIIKIYFISQNKLDQRVEVSFQYANDLEGVSLSFANNISTPSGGSHLTGFKSALTRVLNKYAENNNFFSKEDERLTGEDVNRSS